MGTWIGILLQKMEKKNFCSFMFEGCIFLSIKVRERKKKESSEKLHKNLQEKKSRVKSEKQNK